jgi:hypothetical protein
MKKRGFLWVLLLAAVPLISLIPQLMGQESVNDGAGGSGSDGQGVGINKKLTDNPDAGQSDLEIAGDDDDSSERGGDSTGDDSTGDDSTGDDDSGEEGGTPDDDDGKGKSEEAPKGKS